MTIWIIAEIGFIQALTWAQVIYVVSGLSQLLLVFSLLGIVSWLPREIAAGYVPPSEQPPSRKTMTKVPHL